MENTEVATENQQVAVQLVTIKSLTPIFKGGEPATSIELVNCEEHQFNIISQKGIHKVGDIAFYIQPDYCLPLIVEGEELTNSQRLFSDFTQPEGNVKKSKLGKQGRIRAVKFNFNTADSTSAIYSMGVLMPTREVVKFMGEVPADTNLDNWLSITKYEEPEKNAHGLVKGTLPLGMYKTDETNAKNINISRLDKQGQPFFPRRLVGTLKADGSSITTYYKNDKEEGICSRQMEMKLDQVQVVGYELGESKYRKHYDRESCAMGWMETKTNKFTLKVPEGYTAIEEVVPDVFVDMGRPILNKLREYCKANNRQLATRGELCGAGMKGSGNKNNPHSSMSKRVELYAIDDYSTGVTQIIPLDEFYAICKELGLQTTEVIFDKVFNNYDELKTECDAYFVDHLIEGIVIKDETAQFSVKYMNEEYDSKK